MSDSRQPGSPGVDLDALEPLVLDGRIALTRDDEPGDEGPSEELVALVAELRTLRARVAELETPYGPMLSASERDMYRARVSELETETIALRARVGELEVPDAEADRILTMSAEELDAEIRAVGIDPAELDKRASHVAKWAAECSKLRARVGGLEAQGAWEAVYKEEHQLRREAEARAESAEARVKELEAQYAAIAHAVGVEHAPDTGPTHPGPFAAVLASVEENARNAGRYWELESEVARLREEVRWRPADEHPEEEGFVLAWCEGESIRRVWFSKHVGFEGLGPANHEPTQWLPLPRLPAILEVEAKP